MATQRDFLSENRRGVLAPSPPPPRPARASRERPQRSRPEHRWPLSSPSQRRVDLEVAFAYPPPHAVWWLLGQLEARTAEVHHPAPPPGLGTQDLLGGGELQAHQAPEVKPFGLV